MVVTAQWIIDKMEAWAPAKFAMESDNVGLLIGDRTRIVNRILTALDLSENVLREAVQGRFDFVITHHPLISNWGPPISRITADDVTGKKIMTLISNGIGLFTAHTNLDVAPGGVNDLLFELLELTNKEFLTAPISSEYPALGLVGNLKNPIPLSALAEHVSRVLSLKHIRYVGKKDKIVQRLGLMGGSGSKYIEAAIAKKCDAYLTGDISHHQALDAMETGIALIDGTHYSTENPIVAAMADYIRNKAYEEGAEIMVQPFSGCGRVFKNT